MFRKKRNHLSEFDSSPTRLPQTEGLACLQPSLTDKSSVKSVIDDDLTESRPQVANICLLGDENVGKSSILFRFVKGSFKPDYLPTIGGQCHSVVSGTSLGRSCHLCVRDVSGNPSYRSVIHKFIRGARVVVFVFDLTSRKSFDNLSSWRTLLTNLRIDTVETFILCGNKTDRVNERQVSCQEGIEMSNQLNCSRYLETSAKNNSCIKELKYTIINSPECSDNTSISSNISSPQFKRSAWQNRSIIRRTSSANRIDLNLEGKTKVQNFFFQQSV